MQQINLNVASVYLLMLALKTQVGRWDITKKPNAVSDRDGAGGKQHKGYDAYHAA